MTKKADELRQEIVEILPRLNRFAISLTGVRSEADDLLQATVARLLEKGAPNVDSLDRWAFRICKNIWIDEIRAKNVRYRAMVKGDVPSADVIDGERVVMGKLTFAEINRAMDALPAERRVALSLVAIEGYTCAQAADILGVPMGTVMSRVARARAALSAALRLEGSEHLQRVEESKVDTV